MPATASPNPINIHLHNLAPSISQTGEKDPETICALALRRLNRRTPGNRAFLAKGEARGHSFPERPSARGSGSTEKPSASANVWPLRGHPGFLARKGEFALRSRRSGGEGGSRTKNRLPRQFHWRAREAVAQGTQGRMQNAQFNVESNGF